MAKIDAFDGSMTEEEYHELADMADTIFQKLKTHLMKTTEELIEETLGAFEVKNITKGDPKFSLGAYLNTLVAVAKEEERKRIIDEYGHYSPSDGSECEEYLSTALKEEALLSPKTNPND